MQYCTRPLQQYITPNTTLYQLRHYYSKVHEANAATLYNVSQAKHQVKSIQFSSAKDGIYALGKAHMRSTPSVRSLPNVALKRANITVMVDWA